MINNILKAIIFLSILLFSGCTISNKSMKNYQKHSKAIIANQLLIDTHKNEYAEQPPVINIIINNVKSQKAFKIGDELLFSIDSESKLDVYATFPGIRDSKKFIETAYGHYELSYTIDQKVDASNEVIYTMIRKNGIKATYIDPYGKLTFDNTPPSLPKVSYNVNSNKVFIILENTKGDEIDEYVVEGFMDGEYKIVARSKNNNKLKFDIEKDEELSIKAYFVDKARNISSNIIPIKISNYSNNRTIKRKESLNVMDEGL